MKLIFDVRGTIMLSYFRGKDPQSKLLADGTLLNSASWGFSNWLEDFFLPHIQQFQIMPIDMYLVWDGGNDYRKKIYPKYKANREPKAGAEPCPEAEAVMKNLEDAVKSFSANMGATNVRVAGVEADDVIALICKQFAKEEKIVLTVDADLLQLVDEYTVVKLKDDTPTDTYKGIPIGLLRLHKAMVGDQSDNYVGINRFGPKAWESMVAEFGWDGMFEIDQCFRTRDFKPIEEAARLSSNKALRHAYENLSEWKLGYQLASLHPELCYAINGRKLIKPEFYTRVPNFEKATAVARAMRASHRMEELEFLRPSVTLVTAENFDELLSTIVEDMEESPLVAYDYESYDTLRHPDFAKAQSSQSKIEAAEDEDEPVSSGGYVDILSQEVTGASFAYGCNLQHSIYVPIFHRDTANVDKSSLRMLLNVAASKRSLYAHNAGFELQVGKQSLEWEPLCVYDTRILATYVDENERDGLKLVSKRYLNYDQTSYAELLKETGAKDMSELTGEQVLEYGADDAIVTAHFARLANFICQLEGQLEFVRENETYPVFPLNEAFETGVRIDFDYLAELRERDAATVKRGMAEIRAALEEHCQEQNSVGARNLADADGDSMIALWRDADIGRDKAVVKLKEAQLRWELASTYKPYAEKSYPWDFTPTPAKLNAVAKELGLQSELPSASKKAVSEWVSEVKEEAKTPRQAEFIERVATAAHLFKSREGAEYEALQAFCQAVMEPYAKRQFEGDELNLNSPRQMTELLYCKLKMPVRKRTKVQRGSRRDRLGLMGSPGTDEKAMKIAMGEDFAPGEWQHELLKTLIEVKACLTRESLYYAPYPYWKHPRDGMIHPSIKNCGTVTRRPTGGNPNILQVSKGEVRKVFLPRYDGHVICALDFNGQELRITGSEAKDPVLIDCYTGLGTAVGEDGITRQVVKDVHSVTSILFAEQVFWRELRAKDVDLSYAGFRAMLKGGDEKLSKVAQLCRKMAKAVNFLIIYGGGPSTLAINLSIAQAFAEEIMELVFEGYPRLGPWQRETIKFAERYGFVTTAYGTRKHLTSDIVSRDGGKKSRMERQAINHKVQGCAADILKKVLTDAHKTRLFPETRAKLVAPVYDELVASVPMATAFEYCERLQGLMNLTPPGHAIPMMAEVSIGDTWGGVVELGPRPAERSVIEVLESFQKRAA